ncbi:CD209 antigen isoform X10 [Sapajus apella]|uniref:CD209 antigen isoform X10 n=1 Tax=Sapajus apella TaxID=9515 RepID=A0A6J3FRE2_SAPAP|nr:CD209 antigen isoform X10 [Sapajus apella]
MSDSQEPRLQKMGFLEEEQLRGLGFRQTRVYKSLTGCLGHGPLALQLLSFTLLAGLLVAILVQVSKVPSSISQGQSKQQEVYQELIWLKAALGELPEKSKQQIYQKLTELNAAVVKLPEKSKQQEIYQELTQLKAVVVSKNPSSQRQEQSMQEEISQDLTQLKAAVERLCRPCPWEWTFFQGNCYFISNSQRNWHDSVTACQEVGAQLVIIKSDEEQNFLQLQSSRSNRLAWMGLSDLHEENTWQWVDGSPLSPSLRQYWNQGEPNNIGEEDCAEFNGNGWNDDRCSAAKFWICKKSAASCSKDEGWLLSSVSAPLTAHAA